MPTLQPLQQWYCDTCGEIIERPEDGYVIWDHDEDPAGGYVEHSFQIIHHTPSSPRQPDGSCDNNRYPSSLPLADWIGTRGLIHGFSMIDPGEYHLEEFSRSGVRNLREWVEFMRRLQLPYYEEARQYWTQASNEYFEDVNEVAIYRPDYLRRMIEHFE